MRLKNLPPVWGLFLWSIKVETKNKVVATFDWDYIEHDVFDILSKNHPEYHGEIDWDWIFGHLNRKANAPNYFFLTLEASEMDFVTIL